MAFCTHPGCRPVTVRSKCNILPVNGRSNNNHVCLQRLLTANGYMLFMVRVLFVMNSNIWG